MTTGELWNVDDPYKPWCRFDVDASIEIPFDWAEWLDSMGEDYASHTFTCDAPIEVVSSRVVGKVIMAKVQFDPDGDAPEIGTKYGVTCHIVTTPNTNKEDFTLWFKAVEK